MTIPCENCHTSAGWKPIRAVPEFDHNKTKYPLRGLHEKVQCTQCHIKPVFTDVGKNCADCHADIHRRQMGSDCAQCHTVNGWEKSTQQVKDHQNRFPLFGAHAAVPCEGCHKQAATGQFLGLSTQCDSCHLQDWKNTTNPPHASAGTAFASGNCQGCHSFDSWLGAKFDHSTTGFLLTAGHANVACALCHINNNYNLQIAPSACGTSGCHLTTWQQTNNPPHPTAGPAFAAANCANCHTTAGWTTATFDHSTTGFLLTNGHANVACAACHINNNYNLQIAPTNCGNSGCHLTTWQQTNNPVHSTSGPTFATANCANCHTTVSWTTATFDHSTTGFALTGAHTTTACALCHVNNNYTLTAANTDCYGCHQAAWTSTQTLGGSVPNHVTAGFPTAQCATCHNTTAWSGATFDHSTTGFPLTNSHQMAPAGKVTACAQCHINNNYALNIQPTDCGNAGCHLSTWQTTNNPTHPSAGAPFAAANCSTCHNTITWTTATFDHSTTGWPLVGSHQLAPAGKVVACTDCHVNNNYTFTAANTDCYGCHQAAWQSTQTLGGNVPDHITAGFPTSQCSTCHDMISWLDGKFDHSTTGFPLTNSHQMAPAGKVTACAQCHINNNYALTIQPTDCGNSGCHLSTWQTTNNPTHPSAGAPFAAANCSTCHNTITWTTATFNHSTTGWPLVGSHQLAPAGKVVACTDCHVNNNYTFTAANTDCYGCHQAAWQSTQTLGGNVPNHITAGFPTSQCSTCHDMISWLDGKFDHSTTGFPLTNSHQMAPAGKVTACAQCHINNNYALTIQPTDCGNSGCHLSTWQTTNNPTHPSAGAPFAAANCSTCHNTITWTTATFDHSTTGWPLTGSHQLAPAGKVVACTDCHVNNNYTFTSANTDCYGCHQAAWTSTQTLGGSVPNHVSAGFPTSQCSTCHNTTTWATSTFNHANTGFTLTGAHLTTACALCHVNGNYALTSANTTCIGCHLSAWNSTQTLGGNVPNHITTGFPQAQCATCHDTVAWVDGKFDHSTTGWALTGAHLTTACALCHVNGNYTLTSANTACYGCHLADWNSTQTLGGSVPNHISAGYPTTCDTCHTTTAWTGATFNHTWFPVPHHGSVCADCHQVSTDYTNFTCIACHTQNGAHAQSQTDNTHQGVGGYVYGPETCYACHKNGGGG
ncbi:MAG TPA: hypothetical protein VGF19_08145 [Candidatus Acidoferrum sp.]